MKSNATLSEKGSAGRSVYILGVTALVIAPALLLYAYLGQSSIRTYQQHGVTTQARVVDKGRSKLLAQTRFFKSTTDYYVKVSFVTAPISEGGTLVESEIRELVHTSDWESLQVGEQVDVIYQPDDPEQAVLKDSLSVSRLAPAERYEFGLGVLVVGGLLVIIGKRMKDR